MSHAMNAGVDWKLLAVGVFGIGALLYLYNNNNQGNLGGQGLTQYVPYGGGGGPQTIVTPPPSDTYNYNFPSAPATASGSPDAGALAALLSFLGGGGGGPVADTATTKKAAAVATGGAPSPSFTDTLGNIWSEVPYDQVFQASGGLSPAKKSTMTDAESHGASFTNILLPVTSTPSKKTTSSSESAIIVMSTDPKTGAQVPYLRDVNIYSSTGVLVYNAATGAGTPVMPEGGYDSSKILDASESKKVTATFANWSETLAGGGSGIILGSTGGGDGSKKAAVAAAPAPPPVPVPAAGSGGGSGGGPSGGGFSSTGGGWSAGSGRTGGGW